MFNPYRAKAEAEGILNEYYKEAESYKALISGLNLNTQSFLAYMGVRTIEDAPNTIHVGIKAPAKSAWLDTSVPSP